MTEAETVELWAPLAYRIASAFHLPGSDWKDVRQEALIGLLESVRCFDPARGEFGHHAAAVIRRRLTDAIRAASREKRRILTDAHRLGVEDEHARGDVAWMVAERDMLARMLTVLSPLELAACVGSASGFSYEEMSARLGVGVKAVDNAASRARAKLREAA